MVDFPASPASGQQYTSGNTVWTWDGAKWTAYPGSMAMPDAPPGALYGRRDNEWSLVAHTDITDWTATLAPYALTANVPVAATFTPSMDGTASAGASAAFARGDHVHPTDTSRYAASNPSGFQTAAQVTASLASYLPLAGGTMSGPVTNLTLAADPTVAAQAATKHYVDNAVVGGVVTNPNRLINGDMRIDQRGVASGAGGTATGYTVDRWQFNSNLTTKGTWTRNPNSSDFAFPYSLRFVSNSAYAVAAGDYFGFLQNIEADMVSDFQWGSANAQSVTLSFWAYSSLTGTFGGSVQNYGATRSYPFTYSIPVAFAWTRIVITVPGDTAGTWVMNGAAGSVVLNLDLGAGTTYRGPANAWASANYVGATGSVSVVAANGATFYVTGVKLEVGSVATPFPQQSTAKSMADCQRYYQKLGGGLSIGMQGYAGVATPFANTVTFQAMRAAPTATVIGNWTNSGAGGINLYAGTQAMLMQANPPAVSGFNWYPTDATGFITLSAEL